MTLLSHPQLLAVKVESDGRPLLVHGVPLDVGGTRSCFNGLLQELIQRSSPVQQITDTLLELVSIVVDHHSIAHHAAPRKHSTINGGKPFLFTYKDSRTVSTKIKGRANAIVLLVTHEAICFGASHAHCVRTCFQSLF